MKRVIISKTFKYSLIINSVLSKFKYLSKYDIQYLYCSNNAGIEYFKIYS